jgi:hypothetical protein
MRIANLLILTILMGGLSIPAMGAQLQSTPDPLQFEERKGWKPFWATIFMGNRVGLEYNEGRNFRGIEIVKGIPVIGFLVTLPKFCAEALSLNRMQHIANETEIDEPKRLRYDASIDRLRAAGDHKTAKLLVDNSPLNEHNYPYREKKMSNRLKAGMLELFVGHRDALEWNEGRKIRKVEWASILIVPRIFPAVEAFKGKRMSDIARANNLDENFGKETQI